MKISLVFSMLLVLINFSCSKEKKLDGIFELRLGMSEKEIREVVDETLLEDATESISFYSGEKGLKQRLKGFSLKHYVLDDSYSIEKIHFSFFDDKLYAIRIKKFHPKTEELLTQKYGLLREKTEKYSVGKTWNTNDDDIDCFSSLDSVGDPEDVYFLSLFDEKIFYKILHIKRIEREEKESQDLLEIL